jgi:hypothetical protein
VSCSGIWAIAVAVIGMVMGGATAATVGRATAAPSCDVEATAGLDWVAERSRSARCGSGDWAAESRLVAIIRRAEAPVVTVSEV